MGQYLFNLPRPLTEVHARWFNPIDPLTDLHRRKSTISTANSDIINDAQTANAVKVNQQRGLAFHCDTHRSRIICNPAHLTTKYAHHDKKQIQRLSPIPPMSEARNPEIPTDLWFKRDASVSTAVKKRDNGKSALRRNQGYIQHHRGGWVAARWIESWEGPVDAVLGNDISGICCSGVSGRLSLIVFPLCSRRFSTRLSTALCASGLRSISIASDGSAVFLSRGVAFSVAGSPSRRS